MIGRYKFLVLLILLVLHVPYVYAESCMTGDCHADYGVVDSPHQPVSDGECFSCHVQVLQGHPIADAKNFELVEEGAKLCLLCHDAVQKNQVHAPVAEGDCLSCHQVHGAENASLLTVASDRTALCFECHDDSDFTKIFRHGPVAVGGCNNCHNPHASDYQSLLEKPIRENCLECHDDFSRQMITATLIHPPVKDTPCTDCHTPHSSEFRFNLKQKMPDLCFSCHPEVGSKTEQAKVKHQPLKQNGNCGECHSSHFSDERALLQIPEQRLCLNCHGGDSQLQDITEQISGEKQMHGPIRSGRCADCHDPHGSDFFRLLRGNYPAERYRAYQNDAYDLCLRCHEKKLLRFEDTTLYTNFRNGNQNLHFVHVVDIRKGRSCRFCHEPHSSEGVKLISKAGVSFGNWKVPIGFEPTETGGGCTPGCHQAVSYDRETPIENIFQAPAD